jgi:hypothetical protein
METDALLAKGGQVAAQEVQLAAGLRQGGKKGRRAKWPPARGAGAGGGGGRAAGPPAVSLPEPLW